MNRFKLSGYDNHINSKSTALLFIHGNSLDHSIFLSMIKEESLKEYRILAPDLPGHGQTGKAPDRTWYGIEKLADSVYNYVKAKVFSDIVIFGHSLGGHVAIRLSEKLGEPLKGIILAGTPPLGKLEDIPTAFNPEPAFNILYQRDISEEQLDHVAGTLDPGLKNELKKLIRNTAGEFRESFYKDLTESAWKDEVGLLKNLQFPILILNGENDKLINNEYIESLGLSLFNNKAVIVPGGSHCGFIKFPKDYLKAVTEYLNSVL